MTEEQARAWLEKNLHVSRETLDKLEAFEAFLKEEAELQNLISKSTLGHIWSRHFVDSAQLLSFLPDDHPRIGSWVDLGSGAGFPGLIIAILSGFHVTLVESRSRRVDYLERAIEQLNLENAVVDGQRLERVETSEFDVISARAFAPLAQLLRLAARFSTENTRWLLPKGRNAVKELDEVNRMPDWRGKLDFTVQPSLTDSDSGILIGKLRQKGIAAQHSGKKRKKR